LKILVVGDVTSPKGIEHLKNNLWQIRKKHGIDFCVVNGENASFITGISKELAEELLRAGADCITGGNHTLQNKSVYTYLDDSREVLRPINFGDSAPGRGYTILDAQRYRILVINAMGNVHIEPVIDSAYPYIDMLLNDNSLEYDFSILDFHAEATGEKLAMGYAYDGKINVIFGTHTHVQTADSTVLPEGTGYITDVGMCGESQGVLGMDADCVVKRMRTRLPYKFIAASGAPLANAVIFSLDNTTKRVFDIQRISF
jgi:metallophosphoesterase (TIGR00282 family)